MLFILFRLLPDQWVAWSLAVRQSSQLHRQVSAHSSQGQKGLSGLRREAKH